MVLAPTHEEEITTLAASLVNSYRQLPLRLYQIGEKFRNEARPRGDSCGVENLSWKICTLWSEYWRGPGDLRGSLQGLQGNIFLRDLGLTVYQAQASSGAIGGSHSHEFHLECQDGQDTILMCSNCSFVGNSEVVTFNTLAPSAIQVIWLQKGLEIGHTFLLGSKYSSLLDAKFKDPQGKEIVMEMGCYGIGVSRLLAAIVEASHDENGIIWPLQFPFTSYIIPINEAAFNIPEMFSNQSALIDDRPVVFSHKFKDALLTGFPNILVLEGKNHPYFLMSNGINAGSEVLSYKQLN